MKLAGAAILVSRGMKVLQAAPAAYPYRSASLLGGTGVSYYSRIDLYQLQVKPEKVTEVAAAIVSARAGGDQPFGIAALLLEPDGSLWWDWEYDISDVQKWVWDEPLIGRLAEWCEYGWVAFWSCEGDGGQWAFELDGAGGVRECSARRVSAFRAADTRMLRREGLE